MRKRDDVRRCEYARGILILISAPVSEFGTKIVFNVLGKKKRVARVGKLLFFRKLRSTVFVFRTHHNHRLGMPKAADITKARALPTRKGKHLKLNISYSHELISWGMSVYFDNIGLVLQLIEKLVLRLYGVKNARP